VEANISDSTPQPGEAVTVTAPPVFAPGTRVVVNLARASQGATPAQLGSGTAGATGRVSESATIPAVEPGVYWLYVTGVDADGNPTVALVPVVIGGTEAAAVEGDSVEGDSFEAAAVAAPVVDAATPLPAAVAALQSVEPDVEAAVLDAVADGAGVVLSPQGTLQVRTAAGAVQDADTLPVTGASDISQQVTIGAALLLAGTGMVLLRRRRGGFTK
jgi:LPXTG-motif cell wall-anchored protein